jgi:hypothetical protein
MTLETGKKFSAKHASDAQADPAVKNMLANKTQNGEIACAVAFQIAEELKVTPADIGKTMDLMELKLIKCQLGLFGYGPDKKRVTPKPPENRRMEEAIQSALVDTKLACRDAWEIARRFKVPKMAVSAACEALNIKIKPCQLGAF